MLTSILIWIAIVIISAFLAYVIFSPFIYTYRKCKGAKKRIGLRYSLINLLVAALWGLVAKPSEDFFNAMGGRVGRDLAATSNIVCCGLWLYISLGIVMKKTKKAVKKSNDKNNESAEGGMWF